MTENMECHNNYESLGWQQNHKNSTMYLVDNSYTHTVE